MKTSRYAFLLVFSFSFGNIHQAVEPSEVTIPADPFDVTQWTWSGEAGTVQLLENGWGLIGGETGEFLESVDHNDRGSDWLFLRGEWQKEGSAEDGLIIRWNGCEVILYPCGEGWIPSVGNVLFRQEYASPFGSAYEIGLYQDSQGRVDFIWNGARLLEKAAFGYPDENLLVMTVPPGWELGLEQLRWMQAEDIPVQNGPVNTGIPEGVVLRPGESRNPEGFDLTPPEGPPPPHPFLAMDENRHLLMAPGKPVTESSGKLHAGRALVGNGKAKRAAKE